MYVRGAIKIKNVVKKIAKLYEEFTKLSQTRQERRNEKWEQDQTSFCSRVESTCFNIVTGDKERIKSLEKFHGVKMTQLEQDFLQDQLGERKMFCTTDVDAAWARMAERRQKAEDALEKQRIAEEEAIKNQMSVPYGDEIPNEYIVFTDEGINKDDDYDYHCGQIKQDVLDENKKKKI